MLQNFIKNRMAGYLKQAQLYGDWRSVWSKHVWWTREVIIAIANSLQSTQTSVAKLLKNPAEMGQIMSPYYPERSVKRFEELFTVHLSMGGDIVTAAKVGNMQRVEELTKQWYANADDIARFMASINPHFNESEIKRMMYEHLRLTLLESSHYLGGRFQASIDTFDQIQVEAQTMADYFAKGMAEQFPNEFR